MPSDIFRQLFLDAANPAGRIVRQLAVAGPLAAGDIAQATGLARSTVSTALSDLRGAGLVADGEMSSGGLGRPSVLNVLRAGAGHACGILFGLDEIRGCITDAAHNVLFDESVPVARDYDPAEAAAVTRALVARACAAAGERPETLLGIGLAVSGPVSPGGIVLSGGVLPTWSGLDIRAAFGGLFACPLHADNESNCSALAEMTWGAAVGAPDFVLVKADLGVGGAVVQGGTIRPGLHGCAGEFGHMALFPDGDLCRCGGRGCLDTRSGGTHLLRWAAPALGHEPGLAEFVALAAGGHEGCARLIADAGAVIGRGMALVGSVINPPLFVVTGGLAEAGGLFIDPLRAAYERDTLARPALLGAQERTRFVQARFLRNDNILGAAALVLHQHARLA